MSQVMAKSSNLHTKDVPVSNLEFWLFLFESQKKLPSQMCHPNAVFKAVVGCSRINIISPTKLLDISKSLKLRRVDDLDEEGVQRYMAVDGIIKNLIFCHYF